MDIEKLEELKSWLLNGAISESDYLFDEVSTIISLIDFYIANNRCSCCDN